MPKRFCTEIINGQPHGAIFTGNTMRCPPCQARADQRELARRGTTTQRGYGTPHQKLRAQLIAAFVPGQACARCGQPIWDAARADLGHRQGKRSYRGLEHDTCNRGGGDT